MKSTVETLSPTRVRLAVEVPFEELKPSVDKAYREIARQVRVPGFRPGKAPARIIDQRVGRAAVLQEAVNEAIPEQYTAAVREHDVKVLGQPAVDVTEFADGEWLKFTADVDVRPDVQLPSYDSLHVTVDDATISDDEIDEQLDGLRDRFAMLTSVDRAVQSGDYVSIDLRATVNGEEIEGGSTTGLSYEVGSGGLVPGLDETLVGMAQGEEKTFETELAAGDHSGAKGEVTVTVRSVKEKELPPLDDDFAQTASEFETLAELREDIRTRLTQVKRIRQRLAARDAVLDAFVAAVDVPLPEGAVQQEYEYHQASTQRQLEEAGHSVDDYLAASGTSADDFDAELRTQAQKAVKAQLLLDAVADAEQIGVTDTELTEEVVRRAQRAGVPAEQYAQQLVGTGHLPALAADVRRGKALELVIQHATVTDSSGTAVDLAAPDDGATRPEVEDGAPADETIPSPT